MSLSEGLGLNHKQDIIPKIHMLLPLNTLLDDRLYEEQQDVLTIY